MNRKLREAGFAARGLDEAAICQVAHDMTDGFISADTVEMLAVAHRCKPWRKLVELLVQVGRWEPTEDGWLIHDYLEYNPSRQQWEAEKAKKSAAGKRGGQASAQARGQASAQAGASADASADSEASAQADPTRPEPDPLWLSSTTPLTLVREPAEAALVEQVIEAVAQRQLQAASNVRSASGWLASARARIATEWAGWIAENDHQALEQLVDHIEPPAKPNRDPNGAYTRDGKTFLPGTGWVS